MKKKEQLISALPSMPPFKILDAKSGLLVPPARLYDKVRKVLSTVLQETENMYKKHERDLEYALTSYEGSPPPAEYARQQNFKSSFRTTLPRNILAVSRLEKLVQFKVISESSSYFKDTNPSKNKHTFSKSINLGAVDKQMASLSIEHNFLCLLWKCWDEEYLLYFHLPEYVMSKNIIKFSLPTVKENKVTRVIEFIFSVFEAPLKRKAKKHNVGVDLGKNMPYSMAISNSLGQRVASYEASKQLIKLNKKRERLLVESQFLYKKIRNRTSRGLNSSCQIQELKLTKAKASRLSKALANEMAAEIVSKIKKHNSSLIKVEDLSWVTGFKESKTGNSRWSYSKQQQSIVQAAKRIGYKVVKVNARNTSQSCNKCNQKIQHRTKRSVWCESCKAELDRDFNAAMNISLSPSFPVIKKVNGTITRNSDSSRIKDRGLYLEHLLDSSP